MSFAKAFLRFLSTPSARRATRKRYGAVGTDSNFYPRPLRGGRLDQQAEIDSYLEISIHALCEEGDVRSSCYRILHIHFYPRPLRGGRRKATKMKKPKLNISIHALCEEGDIILRRCLHCLSKFLSTPSARRATHPASKHRPGHCNFYPRPLRGGRPFQPPGRPVHLPISIHALCEEGDPRTADSGSTGNDFYPRPLRGGRPIFILEETAMSKFLSTPSARRATGIKPGQPPHQQDFYPRPLRGGRPSHPRFAAGAVYFYPRPLRGGRRTYSP